MPKSESKPSMKVKKEMLVKKEDHGSAVSEPKKIFQGEIVNFNTCC